MPQAVLPQISSAVPLQPQLVGGTGSIVVPNTMQVVPAAATAMSSPPARARTLSEEFSAARNGNDLAGMLQLMFEQNNAYKNQIDSQIRNLSQAQLAQAAEMVGLKHMMSKQTAGHTFG